MHSMCVSVGGGYNAPLVQYCTEQNNAADHIVSPLLMQ